MSLKHPLDHYQKHAKIFETSFDRDQHELVRLEGKRSDMRDALQETGAAIHARAFALFAAGKKLKTMGDYLKLDDAVIKNKKKLFETHGASLLQIDKATIKEQEEGKKTAAEFHKMQKELATDRATFPKNSPELVKWLKVDAEFYNLGRDSKSYFEDLADQFKACSLDKLRKEFILKQSVTHKTYVEVDLEDCEL